MVENEINKEPGRIVDPSSRGHVVRADENQRPVDFSPEIVLGPSPEQPSDEGHEGADPEEVEQARVDLSD